MSRRKDRPHDLPDNQVTSEAAWLRRRDIIKGLGLVGAGALVGCGEFGCSRGGAVPGSEGPPVPQPSTGAATEGPGDLSELYPAHRNSQFTVDRPITPEDVSSRYNNFYEFTTDKERVHLLARDFRVRPWTVEVKGEVHRPQTFDFDALVRQMPLEERVYRFRCVEAWAMVVPWTGFPLSALLRAVEPKSSARYVRLVTANDPEQMPGLRQQSWYPWPYFEALRMDEAMLDLTFVATGIYGHPLPGQHGAPLRLVTPWKYGFKSIKSIVTIELTEERPPTFWNQLQSQEYGFFGNVDPAVPHPRWSQATERMIDTGRRVATLPYNGYGEHVASLYRGMPTNRIY